MSIDYWGEWQFGVRKVATSFPIRLKNILINRTFFPVSRENRTWVDQFLEQESFSVLSK